MDTDTITPPDALADLRGVKLGSVRASFAPERYQRRMAPTFGWLAADATAYLACLAVVLAAGDRLVQLAAALMAGLAVSAYFVWAHDAAHGALFANRRLADVLAEAYGPYLHDRRFRWSAVVATFRACKLYDHSTRRWTTFGRPRARRAVGALGAVLAIIALAGGCGDDGPGSDLPAVEGPVSPNLEVHATEMRYDPDAIAVKAGNVQVVLHNDGTVLHDLRIEDQPFVIEAGAGQTATSQISLAAGRYEMFCSIPGHREAGMTGVLEVR